MLFLKKVVNYIYGIGGRDVRSDDIEKVYNDLKYIIDNDVQNAENT